MRIVYVKPRFENYFSLEKIYNLANNCLSLAIDFLMMMTIVIHTEESKCEWVILHVAYDNNYKKFMSMHFGVHLN